MSILPQSFASKTLWALILLCCASNVYGHHDSPTAKLGRLSTQPLTKSILGAQFPLLDLTLQTEFVYFNTLKQGSRIFNNTETNSIASLTTTVGLQLTTSSRRSFAVFLPIGWIRSSRSQNENPSSSSGLGDAQLLFKQGFSDKTSSSHKPSFGGDIQIGLVVPTGSYVQRPSLSVTDLTPQTDGSLRLVTYNTNASIGSGSISAIAAGNLEKTISQQLSITAGGIVLLPVTSTIDDIRWGMDTQVSSSVRIQNFPKLPVITAGFDYQFHARDTVPIDNDPTQNSAKVGGRHEIGTHIRIHPVLIQKRLQCSIGIHIPLWQYVRGVQLVETVSANLGCNIGWGL